MDYYQKNIKNINKLLAFVSEEDKREKRLAKQKKYREINRDKCLEMSKNWRILNIDRVNERRRELRQLKNGNI